jgi:hypothetical protein
MKSSEVFAAHVGLWASADERRMADGCLGFDLKELTLLDETNKSVIYMCFSQLTHFLLDRPSPSFSLPFPLNYLAPTFFLITATTTTKKRQCRPHHPPLATIRTPHTHTLGRSDASNSSHTIAWLLTQLRTFTHPQRRLNLLSNS